MSLKIEVFFSQKGGKKPGGMYINTLLHLGQVMKICLGHDHLSSLALLAPLESSCGCCQVTAESSMQNATRSAYSGVHGCTVKDSSKSFEEDMAVEEICDEWR